MQNSKNNTRPGLLRRLASMFYESLLLLGVLALLLVVPHVLIGTVTHRIATPSVLQLHFFLALLAYFVWFWSAGRRTLAMKTWRLRLISGEGRPLTPARALLRYLLCWPSLGFFGIGIFWALLDRDGQFLHDRIAGTRIIPD
ncbi:MAG: RDD family protein [Candidatus Accumulibacter sp.]|nr:RDD family protein [Accumulibacter sp.]MBA4093656.1 RDD family protein [Accumulibacter sp.]